MLPSLKTTSNQWMAVSEYSVQKHKKNKKRPLEIPGHCSGSLCSEWGDSADSKVFLSVLFLLLSLCIIINNKNVLINFSVFLCFMFVIVFIFAIFITSPFTFPF